MPSPADDWHPQQQPLVKNRTSSQEAWIQPERVRRLSLDGSSFMVSGELFLRSTPQLFERDIGEELSQCSTSRTTHPSRGLLSGVSTELRGFLLCSPDPSLAEQGSGDVRLLSLAWREQCSARLRRIQCLEMSKRTVGCMRETRLSSVRKSVNRLRRGRAECHARLDLRLSSLVLRHAAIMSKILAEEHSKMIAETEHCQQEQERLELAARLASLAVTAEYRTRGRVAFRRLPPTHPQHARCLRAATENVKAGFFASGSPYGAVRVLDIYKIENRFLLEKFQRAAETTDQCRVKGLFCHVPVESIEHVVMSGMGSPCDADEAGDECHSVMQEHGSVWPAYMDPLRALAGFGWHVDGVAKADDPRHSKRRAEGEGTQERPLRFPRPFSRHSTLEEERSHANNIGWRARTGTSNESEEAATGSNPGRTEELRRAASEPRILVLCRVMISSMYVSPEPISDYYIWNKDPEATEEIPGPSLREGDAGPEVLPRPLPDRAMYDTVYFPKEEEYLLLKETFVLPEFLVVHRFAPRRPPWSPTEEPDVEGKDEVVTPLQAKTWERCREGTLSSGSEPWAPLAADSAASVVAATKAAMERRDDGNGAVTTREKVHPSVQRVPPAGDSGDSPARTNEVVPGVPVADYGQGRGRGSGRDRLEAVERAVVSAFAEYRQEVASLREAWEHGMRLLSTRRMPGSSGDEHREGV